MDSEDTLKKEEERLMRAISRGGGMRAGAVKAAPKVAPKPVEAPKVTAPASNRSSVSIPRSASARSSLSAEEFKKLEHDAQEQERKREEERHALERLDSAHFKKKQHSNDWFDIEFKDEVDEDDTPNTNTNNSNNTAQSVPSLAVTTTARTTVPVQSVPAQSTAVATNQSAATGHTAVVYTAPVHVPTSVTAAPKNSTAVSADQNTAHTRVPSSGHSVNGATNQSAAPSTTTQHAAPQSQGWATDMDQLINSLTTLGSGITPRHKSPQDIALDTSTTTLRSLKWNFAAPLPEPRHAELGVWIKSLGADLRQLRSILESSTPHHAAFPYVTCAGVTQSLVTAVLDSLALVTAAADRKEVSTALLALVDHTLDWFEAMGRDSIEVTALRDSTGEALTALVRQVTAVIKRQTELVSAPQPSVAVSHVPATQNTRQAVVSVVEEAARHAELISETLKAAPYDMPQFKAQLHLLVAAVKKIDPYLTREGDRETVVQSTKHVLEMAIELQSAPESSPLPVLTAISELLRALTAALRSQ